MKRQNAIDYLSSLENQITSLADENASLKRRLAILQFLLNQIIQLHSQTLVKDQLREVA